MTRTLTLLLTCWALWGWAPAQALAQPQAQLGTVSVPIELTLVQLPIPAGFADPTRALPQMRQLGERMTPATQHQVQVGDRVDEVPMVMGITTAVIKGKLVHFYAYSVYRGAADLAWVRSVTRDWLPLAASSNPP